MQYLPSAQIRDVMATVIVDNAERESKKSEYVNLNKLRNELNVCSNPQNLGCGSDHQTQGCGSIVLMEYMFLWHQHSLPCTL